MGKRAPQVFMSLQDAKRLGLKRYRLEVEVCLLGHVEPERFVDSRNCVPCHAAIMKRYHAAKVAKPKALAGDPERYGAEYLSKWRDDLSTWLSRELLDAAVDRGVFVRAPAWDMNYFAGCDASGGRNDSFTAELHLLHSTPGFFICIS